MFVYTNQLGTPSYQSEVKTRFHRYSPNLTETTVSAYSADRKLKLDYTFYLNRSDDFTRVYYKLKVKGKMTTKHCYIKFNPVSLCFIHLKKNNRFYKTCRYII